MGSSDQSRVREILDGAGGSTAKGSTAPAADLTGQLVGPYRIIRAIGSGGMGRVYLAGRADGTFDRQVAVKVVRPDSHSSELAAHFEDECRILARLQHPGIATLLDAGRRPDGSLYVVLEYVDGVPITDYAWRELASTRSRVKLFREVCAAVSFAHHNLIVHCDLKPGNILVGAGGHTKLLDFGIARALTRAGLEANPPAYPGIQRLTPAYASPEQLRGETTQTGMDVFALGVILHEMLTGQRVQQRSENDTTSSVGIVRSPSEVARIARAARGPARSGEIDADLDAILLKALAVDPSMRYRTVDALSDDLDAYLDYRPVTARPLGRLELARKFARRNPALAGTAAAALCAGLLLMGSLGWLWIQAKREGEQATARFQASRELASSVFSIDDSLAKVAGTTASRETLVSSFTSYLGRLHAAAGGDPRLLLDVAKSYRHAADVLGNPNQPNLGDRPKALENYSQATDILRRLLGADVPAEEAALELASARAGAADVLVDSSDYSGAQSAYAEALSLVSALVERHLSAARYRVFQAGVLRSQGDVALLQHDPDRALPLFERAVGLEEALAREDGASIDRRRFLALSQLRVASALSAKGALDQARATSSAALADVRSIRSASGGAPGVTRDLAVALADAASAQDADQRGSGDQAFRESIDMLQNLSAADPADARVKRDLVVTLLRCGDALRTRSLPDAASFYRRAEGLAAALNAALPDPQSARDLAVVRDRLRTQAPRGLDVQFAALVGDRRIPLKPGAHLPAGADRLAVTSTLPAGYVPYALLFGAPGKPTMLDTAGLQDSHWTFRLSGPPAQTVLILAVPQPLTLDQRRELTTAIERVTDPRVVDWDSQIIWASEMPDGLTARTSARGVQDIGWANDIRAALMKLPGAIFAGRTLGIPGEVK
jgi:tetratricopeptide (TPR) repeat protein